MMGPIIILDKSTFQGLSQPESLRLNQYFFINLTRTLCFEVFGTLAKEIKERSPENKVIELSKKFIGSGGVLNEDYRNLCVSSLCGYSAPMTGQCISDATATSFSKDGDGMFVDLSFLNKEILRWSQGNFRKNDKKIAEQYRTKTKNTTLKDFEEFLYRNKIVVPKINRIEDVKGAVDDLISSWKLQETWLDLLIDILKINPYAQYAIFRRWYSLKIPYLNYFAPYACYCLRVLLSFTTIVCNKLFGWDKNHLIDLDYLFYLPFCHVFSSCDNLHKILVPLLKRDDQVFVDGITLKKDMKTINNFWRSLDDQKLKRMHYGLTLHPPPLKDSVTYSTWRKFMAKWKPPSGRNDSVIDLPEDQRALAIQEIETMIASSNTIT